VKPRRTLHPFLQRALALVVLGVALGAGVSAIALPLAEAAAANRAAEQRITRLETKLGSTPMPGVFYDPSELTSVHADHAEAQVALQSLLDRVTRKAGVAVQSVQPLAAEYLGDIGHAVWMEMTISCDLQALTELLQEIDAVRPVVLVRRLQIERGDGSRPDVFMKVRLEAGQAWREGASKP
jgi:hypothetical protein